MLSTPRTESELYMDARENGRVTVARMLTLHFNSEFDDFWSNPIANAQKMGAKALECFSIHAKTASYIAEIAPDFAPNLRTIDTARWALEWAGDGSLVITEITLEDGE